ncbi:MAG: aspartate--tRNA(Asn) ligase [Candidatus Njordarchaeia archaeon]
MEKLKYFTNELDPKMDGTKVRVAGWVVKIRKVGKIVFIRLRDREGECQVIFKKGEVPDDLVQTAANFTPLTALIVEGTLRKANSKEGFEIVPEKIYYNLAETPLPIDIFKGTTELDKRIKYRTIDLRTPRSAAIFKIKSTIANAYREYLISQGFVEIHTPNIGIYVAEGGANVFRIDYFNKPAYLRQSPQLYKQMMAGALERVFEVGPAFRAEPSHTVRHLTEFVSLDAEIAWIRNHFDVMGILEDLLEFIIRKVRKENVEEFNILEVDPPKIPSKPFPKIKYEEAVEIISEEEIPLEGKDIPPKGEILLSEYSKEKYGNDFLFIIDYPWSIRPFYAMKYKDDESPDPKTKSMDLIFRGIEIVTGGQREHRYEILRRQIVEKNLNPNNFGYYLEVFKYGMPPHGGWGLGLDRFTMKIVNLENVREAVLYPRDTETLEP